MIIEAFAKYLQSANPDLPATTVLSRWLWERLSLPPETPVDRVLHCEISIGVTKHGKGKELRAKAASGEPIYVFKGQSESGRRLLNALYQYASSYEQQKWSRWVHKLKASDFRQRFQNE